MRSRRSMAWILTNWMVNWKINFSGQRAYTSQKKSLIVTGRQLSRALRSGKRVYGTLIVSHSPRWLDVIGKLGLDKGMRLQKRLEEGGKFETGLEKYLEVNNRENVLIVNIESVPAMNNLDDILQVKELDGVLIGPHDLSCSLGIPEQYHLKKFDKAVREIFIKAREQN